MPNPAEGDKWGRRSGVDGRAERNLLVELGKISVSVPAGLPKGQTPVLLVFPKIQLV